MTRTSTAFIVNARKFPLYQAPSVTHGHLSQSLAALRYTKPLPGCPRVDFTIASLGAQLLAFDLYFSPMEHM